MNSSVALHEAKEKSGELSCNYKGVHSAQQLVGYD